MEANILGEDERAVGVEITDNNQVEHALAIEPDGSIQDHGQEGYPDKPAQRTTEQGEHVSQARRYAQYIVSKERGYETLPWDLNAERFKTVQQALRELSSEESESFFGTLLEQSLSHYRDHPEVDVGDLTRPYELPTDMIGSEDTVMYEQEIYLDETGRISAVSDVIVSYYVSKGETDTLRYGNDDTPARDPDAKVEISPAPIVAPETFRDYLVYNLRCQVRDCYLMMGVEPPTEYKVLGHGQYRFTGKYHHFEMYPEYHNMNAEIEGYSYEFRPELPISWEEVGGLVQPNSGKSLYDQIKGALFQR
ncbi:hypothetical protein ACERIM_12425 [Natrinema sp. H-ect1]|uniref:hypothetical protein n=1 Tax=Natrinema sp. H-ect1 TaxID=3242700 RepID=UPI000677FE76